MTYVPVTLDWAIGNQSCEEAQSNLTSFACKSDNGICVNSTNGPGYRCNCSQGFQGNPYLRGGCQDIDECAAAHPCTRICTNKPGSYHCSCPWGTYGDGKVDGSGCKSMKPLLYVILGVGFGLLLLIVSSSWLYWVYKKNKLIELKEKFFRQNGGYLLQQQSSSMEGMSYTTKLLTAEELERATNNYDENGILGRGGSGTVYRGILSDKSVVAIKKSRLTEDGSQSEIEQFINEVVILSHINHRNVVKLLGCCLETKVPMLIYEFVSNKTLSHHIHDDSHRSSLSLANRLRIAAEIAGALAYLHSAASRPIIHRDVKSTNILLDDNLTAKVSDFGASRFVPFDQNGLTSLVRGTLGYLDPEYLHTSQFTDRSDVYSFGVVLVELLTGKRPIMVSRPGEKQNLSMHFVSCLKENRLFEILEDRVIDEGSPELLLAVAQLAKRCLKLKGEERPTMKEVAMELEGLRRMEMHPWVKENNEEGKSLLSEARFSGTDATFGTGDSSTQVVVPFNIIW